MLANARICVAVAGSHGKSTTSGMLVTALQAVGRDPSYAIGAVVGSTGTNAAPGSGEAMVVEADEYDYSFLWLKPALRDHHQYRLRPSRSLPRSADVRPRLRSLCRRGSSRSGALVVNGDDPGVQRVIEPTFGRYGFASRPYGTAPGNDWRIDGTTVTAPG